LVEALGKCIRSSNSGGMKHIESVFAARYLSKRNAGYFLVDDVLA
jgi:hypothetical protein